MAHRSDSGSNSAHQNQRPTPSNEDRLPENTEITRASADESDDDEFEEVEELEDEEEENDGSF